MKGSGGTKFLVAPDACRIIVPDTKDRREDAKEKKDSRSSQREIILS